MKHDWIKNCKGYIFDFDGTLIDSMPVWEHVDSDFLRMRGITMVPADYNSEVIHMSAYDTAVYTINRFHLNETPEEVMQTWRDMVIKDYTETIPFKPFAREFLELLRANDIPFSLATASPSAQIAPCMKRLGITDWFKAVYSIENGIPYKNEPDVYQMCAEKMGLKPEETVVIDDSLSALTGAKKAGAKTVIFYDPINKAQWEDACKFADDFVLGFEELLPVYQK